jgi:hypothetical protein
VAAACEIFSKRLAYLSVPGDSSRHRKARQACHIGKFDQIEGDDQCATPVSISGAVRRGKRSQSL